VVHLEILEKAAGPSFRSSFSKGDSFTRCLVRIAYPRLNFEDGLPNLLTAVAGEGPFFCSGITSLKLLDIEFPESYLQHFSGPRFGIDGLRGFLNIYHRPLFLGVVKPNIGLTPEEFSEVAYSSWLGGLDIAKDDEMLGDAEWSPLETRCRLVGRKRKEAEEKTGTSKMYLANITDEVDRLCKLHDIAVREGANAVMVNCMTIGLSAVRMLARHAAVPVVGHFVFTAAFSRLPFFGVSSVVITKLQRLCGCDLIIMPGFGARMFTEEEEVLDNVDACVESFGHVKRSLPMPAGSDWAGTLQSVSEKMRNIDFGFGCGRGVFAHPSGPEAGAQSLHQAWDAIVEKIPLEVYAEDHRELKEAIAAFGQERAQPLKPFISKI